MGSSPFVAGSARKPTSFKATNVPRWVPLAASNVLSSGRVHVVKVRLIEGQSISSITFLSSSTALATGSNQWFALFDTDGTLLRVTSDDTSTAWAANSFKTLSLASSYTVPATGDYYVGICVVASTVPTLASVTSVAALHALDPVESAPDTTNTGRTDPASCQSSLGTLTALSSIPFCAVG